jgi:hypothetical protein
MGRNFWIAAGVVALLIIAFLIWILWPFGASDEASMTVTKNGKPVTIEMQLQQKDSEIKRLSDLLKASEASLETANSTIATLMENCGKKIVYEKAPASKGGATKVSSGNPGAGSGGSLKITKTTEPEADYDVSINSVQKSKVKVEFNEVKFCVRLGEQFWPHLAVNQGKEFPEIVDNGLGGFDLFILPSGSIGSTGKTYGITEDGIYWIADSEVSDWSQFTPYILGAKGFFVKAQKSGNYWIAK